jgi:hypothetical protein
MSKWQPFSSVFNQENRGKYGGGGTTKFPGEKGSLHEAMANSFVARVWVKIFTHSP